MKKICQFIRVDAFERFIAQLCLAGDQLVGPQVRDGAIVYDTLTDLSQLAKHVSDQQSPGIYNLERDSNSGYLGWSNGPQGIKPWLFKPVELLWRSEQDAEGVVSFFPPEYSDTGDLIFLGAKACDLAALALQDQHFLQAEVKDPAYLHHRSRLKVIAFNCRNAAPTCFCASTGDGPHADGGYDLCLTEIAEGFLVEVGSEQGEAWLAGMQSEAATEEQRLEADQQRQQVAASQSRRLPSDSLIAHSLLENDADGRWQAVAEQCLSCGNCTAVCPSCFCHSEQDQGDLDLSRSDHLRVWDSCFTAGHGYLAGHQVRAETAQRYRQWMRHKLVWWHQQYQRSGCVGCGRCSSWCPAGIDFVEVVQGFCKEESK